MNIEALARPEIVAMKPYSSARKEAPGKGILLNANEAPWPLLGEEDTDSALNRYPEPQPAELVISLARLYQVPTETVLITRGSDEGIDLLTRVFCRAGQDAILQCPPTFGMYRIAAQTQGADIVSVARNSENGFSNDEPAILDALDNDSRIKLVFLTSPNNPTGDVIEEVFLRKILQQAQDRALVVVDEAYAEFCQLPSATRLMQEFENLVVLRTMSKAWAAAGLRCGTVLAQPSVISLLRRVIAPYPLASPVVGLAQKMLEPDILKKQEKLLLRVRQNKMALLENLERRPFIRELIPGQANFVLIRTGNSEGLLAFCAQRNVIIRAYPADPGLRDWLRISVGSEEDMQALSDSLDEWEKHNG
jgi:histidinol-phosphate aminotransferase